MRRFNFNKTLFLGIVSITIFAVILRLMWLKNMPSKEEISIGLAFTAHNLCSGLFVSNLTDQQKLIHEYIKPIVTPLHHFWKIDIDANNQKVRVSNRFWPPQRREALFRPGLGCTATFSSQAKTPLPTIQLSQPNKQLSVAKPWPEGRAGVQLKVLPEQFKIAKLNAALAKGFTENQAFPKNTTTILVAHKGQLIAEQYAPGILATTKLRGWSMTKTITASLAALLIEQGKLQLEQTNLFPQWKNTASANIRLLDLLHMQSGLFYREQDRGTQNTRSSMLYLSDSTVEYMLQQPQEHLPNTTFRYSTGDSSLLSGIIQQAAGGDIESIYNFFQQQLFHPIDVTSAIIEFDQSGNFVGSAYALMTPRDWLRLGQLYLQQGRWQGQNILPSDWIEFATQGSNTNPEYGAQLWLWPNFPDLPPGTYAFKGYQQQYMFVIPSHQLVILRTGFSTGEYTEAHIIELVKDILTAIE